MSAPLLQQSERLYSQDSPFAGPRPLGGGAGERLAGARPPAADSASKRALVRGVDVRWARCDHDTFTRLLFRGVSDLAHSEPDLGRRRTWCGAVAWCAFHVRNCHRSV